MADDMRQQVFAAQIDHAHGGVPVFHHIGLRVDCRGLHEGDSGCTVFERGISNRPVEVIGFDGGFHRVDAGGSPHGFLGIVHADFHADLVRELGQVDDAPLMGKQRLRFLGQCFLRFSMMATAPSRSVNRMIGIALIARREWFCAHGSAAPSMRVSLRPNAAKRSACARSCSWPTHCSRRSCPAA